MEHDLERITTFPEIFNILLRELIGDPEQLRGKGDRNACGIPRLVATVFARNYGKTSSRRTCKVERSREPLRLIFRSRTKQCETIRQRPGDIPSGNLRLSRTRSFLLCRPACTYGLNNMITKKQQKSLNISIVVH